MQKPLVFVLVMIVGALLFFIWPRPSRPDDPKPQAAPRASSTPHPQAATSVPAVPSQPLQTTLDQARPILQQKEAIAQSQDLHTTPRQTIDAAQQLATIIELQEQHPEEASRFQAFFLECARDESVITVIRAQCLDRYVKGARLDPEAQKTFLRDFPPEIIRLFEALR